MLRKEDFMVIEALVQRGVYLCDIARAVGVHPKTVSRALARGSAPVRPRRRRPSLLDPYRAQIDQLLAEDVWNARVIWRELQAQGYRGQLSILRDYLRPKRALRPGRVTVRFETAPGRQLQSDWGTLRTRVAGRATGVHFVVHTLGYSRRFHFWGTDREDAEHTYEGLVRAFEYFGGVPAEVLVDNQKAAVLEHRPAGVRFNARFLDLAGHYGFTPRACRPARARTKGKDERMVGYVKHHFFVRYRAFESWAHLNQLAEQWLREEADQRVHGTVREVVTARFAREAPALRPLPAGRYDTSYWELRQVGWDAYVDVRGNRYSVPAHLAGRRVTVRIGLDELVAIYEGEALVARHRLQPATAGWVTVPAHHAPLWAALEVERRPLAVYEEVGQWS
jgi:transposase